MLTNKEIENIINQVITQVNSKFEEMEARLQKLEKPVPAKRPVKKVEEKA